MKVGVVMVLVGIVLYYTVHASWRVAFVSTSIFIRYSTVVTWVLQLLISRPSSLLPGGL